ncbi:L-proline trans-4-hydroxylase isoform X2 [Hyalella azteca]|uniref:L-proline trans-4-hydroxylase isoform X2 n=1 Tax=Hyalella azteca TaxID=294128 RepID=A0A979FNC9_HYAAZ|nr:L-proline trans-4-hydroxylase isoform X2 [Hyalella azteca]
MTAVDDVAAATFSYDGSGDFTASEEMVRAYAQHGFVIIKNLFNESEMNLIRTAIESPDGVQRHAYGRSDGQRTAKLCVWQHPGDDVTGVAVRLEKVAGTMEKLMGGDEVYHYHSKLMMKEAKTGGAFLWHQDYGYWYPNGCLRPDMGTVFMPVDACTEENGCLQVVPGSHQLGRQDHETLGEQLSVERNRLKEILERYPPCPVEMAPGDALFFDCNLLHCSSENNSDKRRSPTRLFWNARM